MLGSLHLYKVEDIEIVKKIYSFMYKHKLNFYVLYTPNNPLDIKVVTKKIQVDRCLIETDKEEIDESVFYDIIDHKLENKVRILCDDPQLKLKIKEMANEVGVNTEVILDINELLKFNQDLNNYVTKNTILELFDDYPNQKTYNFYNFLLNFKILNDGSVLLNSEVVGDLQKESFDAIYLRTLSNKKEDMIEKISVLDDFSFSYLELSFPEPLLFIQNQDSVQNLCEKIIDFKLDIFDQIKNMSFKQYNVIPAYLLDIMVNTQYVSLKNIKEVAK